MHPKMALFAWLSWSARRYEAKNSVLRDRLERVSDAVGQICDLSGVPGASIGVVHNGEIFHTFNYGKSDKGADIDMTSDTVLGVGSITKSFIAAGLSSFVNQGRISWNTTIKEILPEFKQIDPFVEKSLTISDILSHRSGLAGFGDMNIAFQGDGDMLVPKSSLFNLIETFPTQFPLRSDWSYFVWGYALAGEVIERLSGMDLASYIGETLLQPLGLNATTFDPDSVDERKFAKPYAGLSDGTAFKLHKLQEFKDTFFEASGGLYSSVNDMMFGVIGDNVDLLGGIQGHPTLGSVKDERRLMIYHQGSTVGYYSFIAMFPKTESAVVVLVNSIGLSDAADWIARVMIKSLFNLQDGHDYVALAKEANANAIQEYETLKQKINGIKEACICKISTGQSSFIGRYEHPHKPFHIDISPSPNNDADLVLRFQGLEDQAYTLRRLCEHQFEWSLTHDESKKRGRYHNAEFATYVFDFEMDKENRAVSLLWALDPLFPERKETFNLNLERTDSNIVSEAQRVMG
ncbi:hypothetical protein ACLX1H_003200 [Fusarium chlamydosporum]